MRHPAIFGKRGAHRVEVEEPAGSAAAAFAPLTERCERAGGDPARDGPRGHAEVQGEGGGVYQPHGRHRGPQSASVMVHGRKSPSLAAMTSPHSGPWISPTRPEQVGQRGTQPGVGQRTIPGTTRGMASPRAVIVSQSMLSSAPHQWHGLATARGFSDVDGGL